MFGKPKAGIAATDSVLVLDARNASAIAYSPTYPLAELTKPLAEPASPLVDSKKENTGISTGAIVGIVVGVLAFVSIVFWKFFLFLVGSLLICINSF